MGETNTGGLERGDTNGHMEQRGEPDRKTFINIRSYRRFVLKQKIDHKRKYCSGGREIDSFLI